jgi:hypothetical protein
MFTKQDFFSYELINYILKAQNLALSNKVLNKSQLS